VVKNGTVATFNGGGTINVNTVAISGASANSDLVIDGTTVNVNVASTYNGPTFIRNSGTLNANVTDALPTANGRTAVIFDGTGTSVLSLGAAQSVASLTSAGAATVTLGANTLTVGTSTGSTTFAGIIGGTGGLIKDGASTQILTGANTYSGLTTVSTGVLNIQNASALGTTAAGTNVTTGAALQIQGGITTGAEALTLSGTGVSADGALRNISGDNNYAGLVTLGAATRINSDAGTLTLSNTGRITGSGFGLTVGGAGNTTIAGIGIGSGTLTKDGAGTLTLTQSSTFSGGLAVNAGTVRLLTSGYYALPTTPASAVSIASGAVLTADQTANNHHHIGVVTLNGGTLTSINGPAGPANDGGYGIFFLQGGVAVGGSSMSTISATTVGFNNGSFNVGDVAVGTDLLVSSSLIAAGSGSLIKT
jgi:autotransporter-associated beta strand protein